MITTASQRTHLLMRRNTSGHKDVRNAAGSDRCALFLQLSVFVVRISHRGFKRKHPLEAPVVTHATNAASRPSGRIGGSGQRAAMRPGRVPYKKQQIAAQRGHAKGATTQH